LTQVYDPTVLTTAPIDLDRSPAGVCYSKAVTRGGPLPKDALDHLDALYRVARQLTGNDADAEDLLQETYTRAVASAASFAPDTNLRAWLFRILRNAHIDAYRRARANPARGALADDDLSGIDVPAQEPLRGDAGLERIRGAVAANIEAALASLGLDGRTIILLDLEGFTESELADVLGCAIGTVKSRLSRARALLRDRLKDYRSEGGS
jgi:RNA polymerase sigma-70 factor, ECF subfamily